LQGLKPLQGFVVPSLPYYPHTNEKHGVTHIKNVRQNKKNVYLCGDISGKVISLLITMVSLNTLLI
jgi:hypothetical protein